MQTASALPPKLELRVTVVYEHGLQTEAMNELEQAMAMLSTVVPDGLSFVDAVSGRGNIVLRFTDSQTLLDNPIPPSAAFLREPGAPTFSAYLPTDPAQPVLVVVLWDRLAERPDTLAQLTVALGRELFGNAAMALSKSVPKESKAARRKAHQIAEQVARDVLAAFDDSMPAKFKNEFTAIQAFERLIVQDLAKGECNGHYLTQPKSTMNLLPGFGKN